MPDLPLDIEQPAALLDYLHRTNRLAADETPPAMSRLSGGVSNRAIYLRRANGEEWVLKQALPQLRVAVQWFSDPRRIEREALGMRRLGEIAPAGAITPLLFEDPARHLLAMSAVPAPHENWKTLLLAGRVEDDHVAQFATLLGTIHRTGWLRREQFASEFADTSFFESLRLEPYYGYAAERMPAVESFLHKLMTDTRTTRLTLVHGDYSPKNVLVHKGRLVLLDHEVIHFGDPAFDLGFALTHLLAKANHLGAHRDAFARAARLFWRGYREALGDVPWVGELEQRVVRHTLGCLLARVIGRSPLEYLKPFVAALQANAASSLMLDDPPRTIDEMVSRFVGMV